MPSRAVASAWPSSSAPTPSPPAVRAAAPATLGHRRGQAYLEEALGAVDRVFGKGRTDVAPRAVKDLIRELERILGERSTWTMDALPCPLRRDREVIPARGAARPITSGCSGSSRASACAPASAIRSTRGAWPRSRRFFHERVSLPAGGEQSFQQFWIAWRRAAGGLDEAAQAGIRDVIDPLIAPSEARLKKPKGWIAEAPDDLLDLAAALERLPPNRRSELGGWVLERTWTSRDPRLWAAIGRIGARVPAYASLHHVVSPVTAERWIDHLLREKWADLPTAPEAAVQLARVTGDRGRDVSERARREVERRLVAAGAKEALVRAVRELVPVAEAERAAFFGEGLPVGLRLVE